jgi:hypothetical protein
MSNDSKGKNMRLNILEYGRLDFWVDLSSGWDTINTLP